MSKNAPSRPNPTLPRRLLLWSLSLSVTSFSHLWGDRGIRGGDPRLAHGINRCTVHPYRVRIPPSPPLAVDFQGFHGGIPLRFTNRCTRQSWPRGAWLVSLKASYRLGLFKSRRHSEQPDTHGVGLIVDRWPFPPRPKSAPTPVPRSAHYP